jgi:hypothetical protein
VAWQFAGGELPCRDRGFLRLSEVMAGMAGSLPSFRRAYRPRNPLISSFSFSRREWNCNNCHCAEKASPLNGLPMADRSASICQHPQYPPWKSKSAPLKGDWTYWTGWPTGPTWVWPMHWEGRRGWTAWRGSSSRSREPREEEQDGGGRCPIRLGVPATSSVSNALGAKLNCPSSLAVGPRTCHRVQRKRSAGSSVELRRRNEFPAR